jgi:cephalosporin-C deacetylase
MRNDVRRFWDRALAELRALPLEPWIAQAPAKTPEPEFTRRSVSMTGVGPQRIYGHLHLPGGAGEDARLPAVLLFPGYGGFAFSPPPTLLAHLGMAVLTLYPRGHGEQVYRRKLPFGTKLTHHLTDPERYFYRGCYLDCVRAVDFAVQLPWIDPQRIAIWSASQGAGLALATAALDARIATVIAELPLLCNFPAAVDISTAPYAELGEYLELHPLDRTAAMETLALFDNVNLADEIDCPVLMSIGMNDEICPPHTISPVFERIRAKKSLIVYPDLGHTASPDFNLHALSWLQRYL